MGPPPAGRISPPPMGVAAARPAPFAAAGSIAAAAGGTSSGVSSIVSFKDLFRTIPPALVKNDFQHVLALMDAFIAQNDDPITSHNFQSQKSKDDIGIFERLLAVPQAALPALRVVKILSRKAINRPEVPLSFLIALETQLLNGFDNDPQVVETANVCLNLCYETQLIRYVSSTSIPKLLVEALPRLVPSSASTSASTSASSTMGGTDPGAGCAAILGALQSLCYAAEGKAAVATAGVLPLLVSLLWQEDELVRERTLGTLHNLSADLSISREIFAQFELRVTEPLVISLRNPSVHIAGPAAGCIQNLSRLEESRATFLAHADGDAVDALTSLLFCAEPAVQVHAVGALMNLLGPDLEAQDPESHRYAAFQQLLSQSVALGGIFHALFSEETTEPPPLLERLEDG